MKRKNTNQAMTTKKRTPQQWREGVDKIQDPRIRRHAACVIYWDNTQTYYHEHGQGEEVDMSPLEQYVDYAFIEPSIATEGELFDALRIAGYTKIDAFNRSRDKKCAPKSDAKHRTETRRHDTHAPRRKVSA